MNTAQSNNKSYLTDEQVKQCQLRMLDVMDEFCEAHNLTYWLAYGSLIGAVRHQGYIPWDDDLDLAMPLSSYLRFLEAAATPEGQAFFSQHNIRVADDSGYVSGLNNPPYHQTFAKLYDTRTQASQGVLAYAREGFVERVFVDIFPVVGLSGAPDEESKLRQLDRLYARLRYASEKFFATIATEGKKCFLKRLVGYLPARAKGYQHWLRAFCKLRNTFPDALECDVWAVPDSDDARYHMGKQVETVRLPFEGRMVPAPADYDTFLRGLYGNYLQLPPEQERVPLHAQGFWWVDKPEGTAEVVEYTMEKPAEEITPLRKYQLVELQILKEFMRVCKENNLTWWAGAGTLLGAVRHQGFIPWDDDIDLFMPVEDYLKFRELALHGALNDEYYFQCHTTCVYDPIYQQRIGLKNTTSLPRDYCNVPGKWGICIDIFPLAPAPALDDAPGSKKFAKAEKRFDQLASRYYYKKEARISGGLCKLYCLFMSRGTDEAHLKKWVVFEQDFLAGKGYKETPCFAASPGRLSASSFAETVELPFEDIMVPAPAGYDCFLTEMYGANYMELPPAEKRICHSGGETNNDMIVSFTEPWTTFLTC